MLTQTRLLGTTVLGRTIGQTYDLRGDRARLQSLYRRNYDGVLMMQYRITCLHYDPNTGFGQCSWHGDSRTVSQPVTDVKFHDVVTAQHWYCDHRNGYGDYCPSSGLAIDPATYDEDDQRCPNDCPQSYVEDEDAGR